jgi:D-aspartate ligase
MSRSRGRLDRRADDRAGPPILILGLAGLSMAHGALGAVRSAGRLGIAVFLAHGDRRCPVDVSRYSSGALMLPREASSAAKLELLVAFGRQHRQPVLLPVDDQSTLFVEEHTAELEPAFRFPWQPTGLGRTLADKRTMYELCLREGVPTPGSTFPQSESESVAYADEMSFPLVLKRIRPFGSSTGPNVRVVHDRRGLIDAYRLMESPIEPDVMLQEHVPDVGQPNWIFNGYFDEQSRCRVAFTGRKLRQAPPHAGAATMGVCEANEAIEDTTTRFLGALDYRGVVDVDYRLDCRDGQYKLLDVNPRIGASFRLFVADDGTDVLRAMYMDLTGGRLERVSQPEGRRWIVEPQDLRFALAHIRDGDLTPREWACSLRHVDERAWWAWDDLRPSTVLWRALLVDRARKILAVGADRVGRWLRSNR